MNVNVPVNVNAEFHLQVMDVVWGWMIVGSRVLLFAVFFSAIARFEIIFSTFLFSLERESEILFLETTYFWKLQ